MELQHKDESELQDPTELLWDDVADLFSLAAAAMRLNMVEGKTRAIVLPMVQEAYDQVRSMLSSTVE